MKKTIAFILAAAMMLTFSVTALAADTSRQYVFELTANGSEELDAETGDVLEVVCMLRRTDGADEDLMYALQNNITWDNGFFNMVPGSLEMKSDVDGVVKAKMGNKRFVSATRFSMNGDKWSCENVICSFRLEVIASSGVGTIESRDAYITTRSGTETYPVTVQNVKVTVSNECEITYNPDNGERIVSVTVESGNSVTLPAAPEKDGYRFKCWRWENTDYAAGAKYNVSTNASFVAVWEKLAEYTLTFDSNGGSAVASMKALEGKTVNLPAAPEKNGNAFVAWVVNGTEYASGSSYKVTKNVLFTAKWEKSTVPVPATPKTIAFTDVASGTYYYDAVLWAVEKNITGGTTATTFSPNANCTRAQMATFLWRAAGCPEPKGTANPFTDVKTGEYFYKAVLWAVENGITVGTSETTFSPDKVCTRGQMATFLYRLAGEPTVGGQNAFGDVRANDYFFEAVLWAAGRNITKGTTATTFAPNDVCSRAQIVTFLYRYYN